MIISEKEACKATSLAVAELMATAARTAPHARGIDDIVSFVVDGEDMERICQRMLDISQTDKSQAFFERDANGIRLSNCMVLIGVRDKAPGLPRCGICGYENCGERATAGSHCAFNTIDLGIALGSAVSIAADNRLDNRILYSAGKAAVQLGMFEDGVRVACGIPLSTNAKSNWHDRSEQGLVAGSK